MLCVPTPLPPTTTTHASFFWAATPTASNGLTSSSTVDGDGVTQALDMKDFFAEGVGDIGPMLLGSKGLKSLVRRTCLILCLVPLLNTSYVLDTVLDTVLNTVLVHDMWSQRMHEASSTWCNHCHHVKLNSKILI